MSIKDLFNKNRSYLPQTSNKDLLEDVESTNNVTQQVELQETYVPQVDYSEPENFAKYGSAFLYYKSALERIYDFFPYDGSESEITAFSNQSLPHEKYIFDNLYPRTNGYANFDGASSISFKGGPNATSYSTLSGLFRDEGSTKRSQANLYETNIYQNEGKPSDYGDGTRESNLKCDFGQGVTLEFWLKAPAPSANTKQTIFHLTNSSGGDSLTLFLSGTTGSPFHVSLDDSSTAVFSNQQIGSSPTTSSIASWSHYAVSFKSASAGITTKFYVNGRLDSTSNLGSAGADTLTQKGTLGYLASGSAGFFSGSLDEFRFWKTERNAFQVGTNWFTQVRGGANTDVSNATLGVYFKFNEGTTGDATFDQVVLDYSGRLTNGTWSGAVSRTLESAMVEAGAASFEYQDPIIYSDHPSVVSLKTDLENKGNFYDENNPTKFINYFPSWVIEENEQNGEAQLEMVSHIIGTYFDKLYLQVQSVATFKQPLYTSASYKPLTFASHLPQSLGLYTPEIFVNSEILNSIANKTEDFDFETRLEDTKNLIYLNLYNNLSAIFKSKGTEKAIKNVLRCFYIDDQIIKLNTYSNRARYELRNNLEQTTKLNNFANFNNSDNLDAVIYQRQNPSDTTNTIGYIAGSEASGYEFAYGATIEADITFPYINTTVDTVDRRFTNVSLFGVVSASVDSPSDTTFYAADNVNFQIFAVREEEKSPNVFFKLTSSISPNPFSEMTSSVFYDVYDNQDWNFSVSIIPNKSGSLKFVNGATDYDYTLRFEGRNSVLGDIRDNFSVEQTLTKAKGENFLKAAKRVYAGAYRQNLTGSLVNESDVLVSGVRYWLKSIDTTSKEQHAYDFDNVGIKDSSEHLSPLDANIQDLDVQNQNTLALSWEFGDVTGSNATGNFYVTDHSSGSALIRDNFGWVGGVSGYQHSGYGFGFATSSSDVIKTDRINVFKFVDPERVISSDMITVVTDNQELYGIPEDVVSYHHTLEKSMYSAISDEMLKFFAGVADFNNLIGDPVNRYRMNYKALEKLRQAFFLRVENVKEVERYIEYYKWFDDSLADIIKQLIPASATTSVNVYDTIESHVLERNKYQSKFPTIEFKQTDPESPALGIREKTLEWDRNHHPISNVQTKNAEYWKNRAEREGSDVISSGNDSIDAQRDIIIETKDKYNSQVAPTLTQTGGQTYSGQTYVLRKLSRPYKLSVDRRTNPPRIIKGGVNFEVNKNFDFHRVALHPAGPVNTDNDVYVPKNVLLGLGEDLQQLENTTDPQKNPNVLVKRNITIQSGRDWEDGVGYKNLKSDIALPFNIVSSSVRTGYNSHVVDRLTSSVELVNVHNDVYGPDMEKPMQGPFTEYAVGGLQYRHVKLNDGGDNYLNRPEGWKILLGLCNSTSGAIGMVGADYPYPEANDRGVPAYPMTGAQKAFLYRDMVAKRPVNIKNIRHTTGSTILGNYNHNYDVVQAGGASSTPRQFVENQPTLPSNAFTSQSRFATSIRTILGVNRTERNHSPLVGDYSTSYLDTPQGESVIISRFAAPGGIEVMTKGYQDFRSSEFSVYNAMNARNLTVRRPFQPVSSSVVSETQGIRVSDIHGRDFGLMNLSTRHAGRFFRDSTLVANPGSADNAFTESPSFHRTHRNNKSVAVSGNLAGVQKYDNFNISHQIPRSDRQYSWITSSIVNTDPSDPRYSGFMPVRQDTGPYYEINGTYVPFFDYVSGSATSANLYQNTTRLNILVTDPTGSETNVLGTSTIGNTDLINLAEAQRLNALLIRRGDNYGWNWRSTRQADHPILQIERKENKITVTDVITTDYDLKPVSYSGRPVMVNVYSAQTTEEDGTIRNSDSTITIKATFNNERLGFTDNDLEDITNLGLSSRRTQFEDLVQMVQESNNYNLNWIYYSEHIFPSQNNSFNSENNFRDTYDNQYWRDSQTDRETIGNALSNSFGLTVSQSSWVLDAVPDFTTRTGLPYSYLVLRNQGGGELQNTYFHYHNATGIGNIISALSPAGLYARKHLMPTYRSVVSPSGIRIPQTGSSHTSLTGTAISIFGGEARWEAGEKAGYVQVSNAVASFVSSASEPWFNNYSDFKQDIKLKSRGYSIVPEFRISEKVSDYVKNGVNTSGLTNTFEIVGTSKTSADSDFYKDYSNSEFLKYFSEVSDVSNTTPDELRLVCKAVTRLNPYKGFYPAQRTIDIVEQFADSYVDAFEVTSFGGATSFGRTVVEESGSLLRPLLQPLFAPGILYNTIKSGMAVDFPVVSTGRVKKINVNAGATDIYALAPSNVAVSGNTETYYDGGQFWDKRLPFETILDPDRFMVDLRMVDMEPHPSASISTTASLNAASNDQSFSKMSSNFFAEVGNFFLKDSEYTTLKSGVIQGELRFESGSVYGARVKLRRSTRGERTYRFDYDATGKLGSSTDSGFGLEGLRIKTDTGFGVGSIPLPQDPKESTTFKETFTMYSRPTAFGPAVWGQNTTASVDVNSGSLDSLEGYNWSFTPPYYNGEAWADLIFYPDHTQTYTLEKIIAETKVEYWRVDQGYQTRRLVATGSSIYNAGNINDNAMQINSCVNLFGIENIPFEETDQNTGAQRTRNDSVAQRWVIQPKAETPMFNFNDEGINQISPTIPTYASESVPRGMWHQFGNIPEDPKKGIFLEIGDIPANWLRFHYSVNLQSSLYNNFQGGASAENLWKDMQSLTDLLNFENSSVRLGELKDSQTIREAIVAVPYTLESIGGEISNSLEKNFFSIPKERIDAANSVGTTKGDSEDSAGDSIRDLVANVKGYVLPPEFDFIQDPNKDAVVMYFFEFEYQLDKDDLAYIWQNIAPRNYKKLEEKIQYSSHKLANNELLTASDVLDNDNLRWMVFKVKQRSMAKYNDKIYPQVGKQQAVEETSGYEVNYNWPYDYVSFVEMVSLDAESLMKNNEQVEDTQNRTRNQQTEN